MTQQELEVVLAKRLAKIIRLLAAKGKEYARGDRLSNFKDGAALSHQTAAKVWWGYNLKHIVSLKDMIFDLDHDAWPSYHKWDEKLGDYLVYGILLDGIIQDTLLTPKEPGESKGVTYVHTDGLVQAILDLIKSGGASTEGTAAAR